MIWCALIAVTAPIVAAAIILTCTITRIPIILHGRSEE